MFEGARRGLKWMPKILYKRCFCLHQQMWRKFKFVYKKYFALRPPTFTNEYFSPGNHISGTLQSTFNTPKSLNKLILIKLKFGNFLIATTYVIECFRKMRIVSQIVEVGKSRAYIIVHVMKDVLNQVKDVSRRSKINAKVFGETKLWSASRISLKSSMIARIGREI